MTLPTPCLLSSAATTIFDASGVCGTAPFLGYFYIHNSCNMTLSFTLTVRSSAPRLVKG